MVSKCAVHNCENTSKKAKLHRFPKDPELFKMWTTTINRTDIILSKRKNFFVCDIHFSNAMKYEGTRNRTNLIADAYPTLFLIDESGIQVTHSASFADETATDIPKIKSIEDAVCKKRWTNIRDQFKRSLNRRKSKDGQVSAIKKYKYEESLQFLLPHIHEMPTNVKLELSSQDIIFEDNTLPSPVSCKNEPNIHNNDNADAPAHILAKGIQHTTEPKHPIDAFLEGLAPTLKNLPPFYQHLAKGKIFSIVQQLEAEAMHFPQSSKECKH